jgi:hypothetical protein
MRTQTERARSISPDKPTTPQSLRSAAGTPRSVQDKAASMPAPLMSPPPQDNAREESLQRLTSAPAPIALEDTEPKKPAASAAALGRSGTLSWNQRPQSGSLRRPLSMASRSPERSAPVSPTKTPDPASPERPPSRTSIAASLGAKDPSWFKQTPDRGAGSAAYRRSQEDTASDAGSISGKRQLPGMSRESTIEPDISSPPPESMRSSPAGSRRGSTLGGAVLSNRFSASTSVSAGDAESVSRTRSPLPMLDSQKFAPPSEQSAAADAADAARALAMSPTQGRMSPERPASPTKGMGGFVQSAMLKRSDSVSKRWSTQAPPPLTRQGSTLSNRGSAIAGYGSLSRPTTLSRDNSIEPASRPASSHSNATVTQAPDSDRNSRDEFVKPALPHRHSRSKSVHSTFYERDQPQDETSPPSPSKRWSPTKSSWLESALNKPDSPKLKQPPPAQPAWMAEINRIKQQRGSVDLGKADPLQSPSAEPFGSGRISPLKDIQLKPASLRKFEVPKKDATESEKSARPTSPRKFTISNKQAPPEFAHLAEASPNPSLSREEDPAPSQEAVPAQDEPVTASIMDDRAPTPVASKSEVTEPSQSPTRPLSSAKRRPATPPKKDFRAGLRSRPSIDDGSKKGEVTEFQNVFGKLRKAETKNYVAPDMLKTNILSGKNALNVTGGPKPTVRRDEFRESLVKKKSAILEKAQDEGSVLKKTEAPSQPAPLPEAIARRGTLGRADSPSKPIPLEKPKSATPEALARKKSLRVIKPAIDDKPVQPAPSFTSKEPARTSKLADRFNPALAGMLARGPPPLTTNKSTSSADGTGSPARAVQEGAKTGPAPDLQHMTKGRARGPKRRAPAAKQTATEPEKTVPEKVTADITAVPLVKPEHVLPSSVPSKTNGTSEELPVTRKPRQSLVDRPAPPAKSARISSGQFSKSTPETPKKPASLELDRRVSGSQDVPKRSPRPDSIASPRISSPGIPKKPASLDPERRASGSYNTPQKSLAPQPAQSPKPSPSPAPSQSRFSRNLPTSPASAPKPAVSSPKPTALKDILPINVEATLVKDEPSPEKSTFASVRNATALWGRQSASTSPLANRTKSPIKLPTRADEHAAMQDAGLVRSAEPTSSPRPTSAASQSKLQSPVETKPLPPKSKPSGLGFSLSTLSGYLPARSRESSPQISSSDIPVSPPASASRPQSEPFKASPTPVKHEGMFAECFDDAPITEGRLPEAIDTVHILKSPPLDFGPAGKIRTLRKQMQEVTGDGKLYPVSMQEEHILFQDSMYLCTHIFGDSKNMKHTDVYLWAGNGVAEPIIEDVQLFAKTYAKQNQARLVTIRQGQELPNFFEALGGIVITRRGAKPASKEFMLCGRRHMGHLAFDEVESSLKSLCSAYPYLVSTHTGKVYLWKGRGCSAEELSGARLMGMDLAPTGDFTEIDEGAEPQDFINAFPPLAMPTKGPAIPRSADHWRYKATSEKYRARLYKFEQTQGPSGWGQALQVSSSFFAPLLRRPSWNGQIAEQRPQTPVTPGGMTINVREIMPFCQRDLEPESIYVLDAFFEMYM